jgi:hypothetical protein
MNQENWKWNLEILEKNLQMIKYSQRKKDQGKDIFERSKNQ